jgi:tripartite-type tricarboxylate transporter receptor subunit TctC
LIVDESVALAESVETGNKLEEAMLRLTRAAACAILAVFATAASAQNYPSAPVKLIVPIPAGGVTDVMARVVGQRLQEMWGQAVVVENRPGGNSGVGAQAVERAPADIAPDWGEFDDH